VITPIFIWMSVRRRKDDAQELYALVVIYVLLIVTYLLTIWQARWGYFFCFDFCAGASGGCSRRSNQVPRSGCVRVGRCSPVARLGRTPLVRPKRNWLNRVERRIESAQDSRSCAQFAIARGASVSRTVVAFAVDCLLVRAAWG